MKLSMIVAGVVAFIASSANASELAKLRQVIASTATGSACQAITKFQISGSSSQGDRLFVVHCSPGRQRYSIMVSRPDGKVRVMNCDLLERINGGRC